MRRVFALVASLAAASCARLDPVPAATCGNGVVEGDEACDSGATENPGCGTPENRDRACRFVCDRVSCPQGFVCDPDRLCRTWAGSFDQGPVLPVAADQWLPGDFDGDGRTDLAAIRADVLRVLAPAGGGRYTDLVPVRRVRTIPHSASVAADLDGDGVDELVVPGPEGLLVFRGGNGLEPVAHGVFRVMDLQPDGDAVAVVLRNEDGTSSVLRGLPDAHGGWRFGVDSADLTASTKLTVLPGVVCTTDLDGDGVEEAIFVARSVPTTPNLFLLIAHLESRLDGAGQPRPSRQIAFTNYPLQVGADEQVSAVLPFDLDGDGLPELIVAAPGRVFDLTNRGHLDLHPGTKVQIAAGPPLAIGDLDGNGLPDFVFADRIELGQADGLHTIVSQPESVEENWTHATIMDIDDDGQLDVLASKPSAIEVIRLDCTRPGCQPRRSTLLLPGTPVEQAAGDFDGDGVTDLAVATSGPDRLGVIYGERSGPPTVGPFDLEVRVAALGVGDFVDAAGNTDGLADIVVMSFPESTSTSRGSYASLQMIRGSPERLLVAPYILDPLPGAVTMAPTREGPMIFAASRTDNTLFRIRPGNLLVPGVRPDPKVVMAQEYRLCRPFRPQPFRQGSVDELLLVGADCTEIVDEDGNYIAGAGGYRSEHPPVSAVVADLDGDLQVDLAMTIQPFTHEVPDGIMVDFGPSYSTPVGLTIGSTAVSNVATLPPQPGRPTSLAFFDDGVLYRVATDKHVLSATRLLNLPEPANPLSSSPSVDYGLVATDLDGDHLPDLLVIRRQGDAVPLLARWTYKNPFPDSAP